MLEGGTTGYSAILHYDTRRFGIRRDRMTLTGLTLSTS